MSELRQDLISGDWIIMAQERARRPEMLARKKMPRKQSPKKICPFENLKKSGNWPPIMSYPSREKWEVVVIPNKYPALEHGKVCAKSFVRGPYQLKTGVGTHDLVITRDHKNGFADLSLHQATRVFQILQERYKMLAKDNCSVYTTTFLNWGPTAGASIYHPHYQVLTLPIIPPNVLHSLTGSETYFKKHKKCAHCVALAYATKDKKRIIEKNSSAVAFTPFVSKEPFEVRIYPRRHEPYFRGASLRELKAVASTLQAVMKKIRKNLGDPDLNFFIHSAPLRGGSYSYYHWHIEIRPKITTLGGFELGTGVDINVVDPEIAAKILNSRKF